MSVTYVVKAKSLDGVKEQLIKYFENQKSYAVRDKDRAKIQRDKRFCEGMEHAYGQVIHFIEQLYIEVTPDPVIMTGKEVFDKKREELKEQAGL